MKILRFVKHAESQMDRVMVLHRPLYEKLQKYSEKSLNIVKLKEQERECNFSAIKLYFSQLKKEFD